MGKYNVEYLPAAYDDLDEIFAYVAENNLNAAKNLLTEIDAKILCLEDFPNMGLKPKNQRLLNKGYRVLIIEDYLVFYVVIKNIVEIRRIISGKRNYIKLL